MTTSKPLHIAIVEDNPVHRETYSNMVLFDSQSHQVETYADGKSLLDDIEKLDEYDCILFDIKLPDMNGIDLSKRIREKHPHIPIIFITAYSSDDEALSTLSYGAEDYLPKGEYNQTLFMRSIRYAIERSKHRIEQLKLQEDLLHQQELNAKQKEFVSMVSHEFRTPLAIIGSSSQLLARKIDTADEKAHAHIHKIDSAIKRLISLIDNALCFTKLEEGKISFNPESMDIKALLESVIEAFQMMHPDYRFELHADGLPGEVTADSEALEHIMFNLLSNAVKYSHGFTQEVSVHASTDKNSGAIEIRVSDKGRGIAKDELDKIGERFFRADNAIGTSGSGIGLFIVNRMLSLHGGKLSVESEQNNGCRVTITIPQPLQSEADA